MVRGGHGVQFWVRDEIEASTDQMIRLPFLMCTYLAYQFVEIAFLMGVRCIYIGAGVGCGVYITD